VVGNEVCQSGKVAIVGVGNVGSTIAYSLMVDSIVSKISLIDLNKDKAEGEAFDLNHCMQFTRLTEVVGGDSFDLVRDAEIVIVSAGIAQSPGQKRTDLLKTNSKIFKQVIPDIVKYNKNCILIVVTNPVDVLTYFAWKLSGFDSCRVFGTGTVLDTARLRYLIGKYFDVSPKDVVAHVLGEHGDSEFVWWSRANISGISLDKFEIYSDELKNKIYQETKDAAYSIIEKKGATFYAISIVIAKIVRVILLDQMRVFSLSSLISGFNKIDDVCIGLPGVIRRGGICRIFDIDLNEQEFERLEKSVKNIKNNICLLS
jgi:L-lactate dehydrogenase